MEEVRGVLFGKGFYFDAFLREGGREGGREGVVNCVSLFFFQHSSAHQHRLFELFPILSHGHWVQVLRVIHGIDFETFSEIVAKL